MNPALLSSREMHAGIDEAGRGPVLGPLIVACVHAHPKHLPEGIQDSKTLTRQRRAALHDALTKDPNITVASRAIPASRINQAHRQGETLDRLEEDAFVHLLESVEAKKATVDTVGSNPSAFQQRLSQRVPACTVTAMKKADETNPLVGAASIVAKHERDQRMQTLEEDSGHVLGSGYPSDPKTRSFLRTWRETSPHPPSFAREAWSTLADLGFKNHTLNEFTRNTR